MSHWSSGLPVCFPSQGTQVQIPWGVLMWNRDSLLAMSCYTGDPDVIDHHCSLVWGRLRPKLSLGPRADNVIIPLDLTQLFCLGFSLAAGPPSSFTTTESAAGGEPCGEPAISLHSHHVSLVQRTTCLIPVTRDPGSHPLGDTYVQTGILLLAMSRYKFLFSVWVSICELSAKGCCPCCNHVQLRVLLGYSELLTCVPWKWIVPHLGRSWNQMTKSICRWCTQLTPWPQTQHHYAAT
jgi:hypothetical protein